LAAAAFLPPRLFEILPTGRSIALPKPHSGPRNRRAEPTWPRIGAHFFDWLGKHLSIERFISRTRTRTWQSRARTKAAGSPPPGGCGISIPPRLAAVRRRASAGCAEDDRQRHERKEDQAAQSGKKQKLFVAVGLMNFRLNEACATRIASSRKAPMANPITAFRRPEGRVSSRIGSVAAKAKRPGRSPEPATESPPL